MSRLVIVSNRVALPRTGTAPGGLAVGVLAALKARGGMWCGWSGEVAAGAPAPAEVVRRDGIAYATFDLDRAEHEAYYLGFSNATLWPLFHYFIDRFRFVDAEYEAYQRVNQRFADQLLPLLRSDDLVWVHDYHLLPLAQRLRAAGAGQPIGLFLHIPFPTAEVLRVLPVFGEILQAMLCYDVIGFQTEPDAAGFRSAVERIWGSGALVAPDRVVVGERRVRIGVFPIGVDVDTIVREASEARSSKAHARMFAGLLGRRLMIGVDRLDYSKGLVERFKAYERFLETHPENQNRVTFLQIAPVSRTDVPSYAAIRESLDQATGRTNGRFADTDWTPIRYLNRNFPHDVLMSFLRAARVGIVTPLRDGMNLVAKEFAAAQDPTDPGVLILSSFAGAAVELSSALLVNPYDLRGIAHAIQQAFTMPLAERRERHHAMLEVLRRDDIHAWHTRFVAELERVPSAPRAARAAAATIAA